MSIRIIQKKLVALLLLATTLIGITTGFATSSFAGDVAVRGKKIYTMDGAVIDNGVVVIRDGKIVQVGTAEEVTIPDDFQTLEAEVVTPGLIDARSVVGLAGILNQDEDQDQLESSTAIQPQLRAVDAYNPHDPLIQWIRDFGVTCIHTGHAPGKLISGQSMVVKTTGNSLSAAVVNPAWGVVATLGPNAHESGGKSPGTRGKAMAMLRQKLIDARSYAEDRTKEEDAPARNLEMESLADILDGKLRLIVEVDRAIDINNALRLKEEFDFQLVLCSAAEAYTMIDQLKEASVPVIVHATMARSSGERENLTFQNAAKLSDAGIELALQSGYEAYVPKTRVVLFEAGIAAAHGFGFERALASITIDAAKLLDIDQRVGSISVGKDGDLALYDGDPFEYTTHCITTIIDGKIVSEGEDL